MYYLSACESPKIKLGASSVVCGMLAMGGSSAGFTLITAGTAALAIPIVGIVIGVSLIIFGSLMLYQAQKKQRQSPSLVGRTVEIPDRLPDQKKIEPVVKPSRVSVLSNIWHQRAMAMAAIVGMYGLMKLGSSYFSSDPTQPTPTGSSAGAAVGGLDTCPSVPAEPVCPVGSFDPFSSLPFLGAASTRNDPWNTLYAYFKTPFSPPSTLKVCPEQNPFPVSMQLALGTISDAAVCAAGSAPAFSICSLGQDLPPLHDFFSLVSGTPSAVKDRSKQAALQSRSFTRKAEFGNKTCSSSDAASAFPRQAAWPKEKRNLDGKENCTIQPTFFLPPRSFPRTREFDNKTCPASDAASAFSRQAKSEETNNLNGEGNCEIVSTNSSILFSFPSEQRPQSTEESFDPLKKDVLSPSFPNLATISKVTIGVLGVLGSVGVVSIYSFWKKVNHIAEAFFGFVYKKASPSYPHHQRRTDFTRKPSSEHLSRQPHVSPRFFFPFGGGSGTGGTIPTNRNIVLNPSSPPIRTTALNFESLPSDVRAIIREATPINLNPRLVLAPRQVISSRTVQREFQPLDEEPLIELTPLESREHIRIAAGSALEPLDHSIEIPERIEIVIDGPSEESLRGLESGENNRIVAGSDPQRNEFEPLDHSIEIRERIEIVGQEDDMRRESVLVPPLSEQNIESRNEYNRIVARSDAEERRDELDLFTRAGMDELDLWLAGDGPELEIVPESEELRRREEERHRRIRSSCATILRSFFMKFFHFRWR